MFSKEAVPCCITNSNVWRFHIHYYYFHILTNTSALLFYSIIIILLFYSIIQHYYSGWWKYEAVFLWFWLNSLMILTIFSCAYWSFICLLWKNVYLILCLFQHWVNFFLLLNCKNSMYILDKVWMHYEGP